MIQLVGEGNWVQTMSEWVLAAQEEDLQENTRLVINAGEHSVLLLKRAGRILAIENRCPHLGCTLARGKIDGFIITCPCHDWQFDIRSGEFTAAPEITIPVYACKVLHDHIYILIDSTGA